MDLICIGAINWDINLFMKRLPRDGEEVPVEKIQRVSGGTAGNVAVASARILGKNKVALIAALGDDSIAEAQMKILKDEGVDTSGMIQFPDTESGQAYISINEKGINRIHTLFGANKKLSGNHIMTRECLKLIKEAKVCVITDPPIETGERVAETCRANGVKVIWDPGVLVEKGLETLLPLMRNVDYFILNHVEYENLLGSSDPETVMDFGRDMEGLTCIIKHGEKGCSLCETDGTITQLNSVPLSRLGLKVVNTVGCGDAFIAGFASGLVEGLSHVKALRWGTAAGGYKATRVETRGGPTRKQLLQLLDKVSTLRVDT